MNRVSQRPVFRHLFACICAILLVGGSVFCQEFIDAESEAPESLNEAASSFDDFTDAQRPAQRGGVVMPALIDLFPHLEPVVDDTSLYYDPRTYYFYRKRGDGSISEAWAAGGSLSYETGWWRDFLKFGATVYTSQKIHGPADRSGTGLLQPNQESYTAVGELHLNAKVGSALATLYRQELDLPYVNRNDIRMTPRTFEGYTVASENEDGWSFIGGHLTQMRARTSTSFEPMSVATGAVDSNHGVTFGGFRYDYSDDIQFGAINFYGWDTLNTFYGEGRIAFTCRCDLDVHTRLQFSSQNDVGNSLAGSRNGQLYGAEFAVGKDSLIGTVAFTSREGDKIIKPWGGDPSFNSLMIADFDRELENALQLGISYDFEEIGLRGWSAFTSYTWGDTPDSGPNASPDQTEFNFTLDYRVPEGRFEDCWLRFRIADNDSRNSNLDIFDFRIIANYSIEF